MDKLDLVIGPLYFVLFLIGGWIIRPFVSNEEQRKYFLPAITVKMLSAIGVGLLYQFYYKGGDTFTYFSHGAIHIWDAFTDSPRIALRLIFMDNDYKEGAFEYAKQIWVYRDAPSYFVVRFAGFFSLFSFGTYAGTALLFSVFSFSGIWAMYRAFCSVEPKGTKLFAVAILFVPSVIFWGSGILKDTLTLAGLGWATWGVINGIVHRKKLLGFLVVIGSLFIVYSVKKYAVLCFVPSVLIWLYLTYMRTMRSKVLKILLAPIILTITITAGYLAVDQISKDDSRYALDRLGVTVMTTAMDIGYWTGKDAGSKYSLGVPDPTFLGMAEKAPAAIVVSLFRPFLWEINNLLMLLSGVEGLFFLIITAYILVQMYWPQWKLLLYDPIVAFCLVFSLTFAFAVGISTYNFGTLSRYKIQLIPFYLIALSMAYILIKERKDKKKHYANREHDKKIL